MNTCARRIGSPTQAIGMVGNGHVQAVAMRIDQRPAGFDGARQHVAQVDGLLVDDELPARHAVDVEQLVDDARQVLALAVDGLAHGLDERIIEIAARHERHGIADRRQRIAQFVRQHRDELVHALRRVGQRFGVPALRQVLRHHVDTRGAAPSCSGRLAMTLLAQYCVPSRADAPRLRR